MFYNKSQVVKLIALTLLLAACSAKVDNRGYSNDDDWRKEIVKGETTKDQVLARLGSPSSQSTFGGETWYYISQRKESVAFLKPEIVQQDVTRIQFDANGTVTSVESYNKDSSHDFALEQRTTPTEGHTIGFFEQVLGNVGRFNSASSSSKQTVAPTRNPGGSY